MSRIGMQPPAEMKDITPDFLRRHPLPDPGAGDKRARGNVLIIGGSSEVPGAALLAAQGALRAGAGRVQIATSDRHASLMGIAFPEALVKGFPELTTGGLDPSKLDALYSLLPNADAVLIGPGLNDEAAILEMSSALLQRAGDKTSFVFDARAIKHLRRQAQLLHSYAGRIVVTPHAGEMAGLMQTTREDVESAPADPALRAAKELGAIIALKGATTYVAKPVGEIRVCHEGNVGLATAGSGDVLAGLIAGLIARGTPSFEATCWGVYLHAKAGDALAQQTGPLGYLARELPAQIPALMGELSQASLSVSLNR